MLAETLSLLAFAFCLAEPLVNVSNADQAAVISGSASEPTYETDRRNLIRRITIANRELSLPGQLENDETRLKIDQLDVDTAHLEGHDADPTRVEIDKYILDQSKEALRTAHLFTWVWSQQGDLQLRNNLDDLEASFDDAGARCHTRSEDGKTSIFRSIDDARRACSDLRLIFSQTEHYTVPRRVVSLFDEDSKASQRLGHKLLIEDRRNLERDERFFTAQNGRKKLVKAKKELLDEDQTLIDHDRRLWMMEIAEDDNADFNNKYPAKPMASAKDLFKKILEFRNDIAKINANYRTTVLAALGAAHR